MRQQRNSIKKQTDLLHYSPKVGKVAQKSRQMAGQSLQHLSIPAPSPKHRKKPKNTQLSGGQHAMMITVQSTKETKKAQAIGLETRSRERPHLRRNSRSSLPLESHSIQIH